MPATLTNVRAAGEVGGLQKEVLPLSKGSAVSLVGE